MPKITHQSTITHHELEKKPNITQAQKPTITHHELAKEPTHEDKKLCWYWLWQVVLQYGMFFDETRKFKLQFPISCCTDHHAKHKIRQNHAEREIGNYTLKNLIQFLT